MASNARSLQVATVAWLQPIKSRSVPRTASAAGFAVSSLVPTARGSRHHESKQAQPSSQPRPHRAVLPTLRRASRRCTSPGRGRRRQLHIHHPCAAIGQQVTNGERSVTAQLPARCGWLGRFFRLWVPPYGCGMAGVLAGIWVPPSGWRRELPPVRPQAGHAQLRRAWVPPSRWCLPVIASWRRVTVRSVRFIPFAVANRTQGTQGMERADGTEAA